MLYFVPLNALPDSYTLCRNSEVMSSVRWCQVRVCFSFHYTP